MALPFRNFTAALINATNDAKEFWPLPFSPTALRWQPQDSDADGKPARDAIGLGLRLTPKANQNPVVLPASLGAMTCLPLRGSAGQLVEQRLHTYLSYGDLTRLRLDPVTNESFRVRAARLVYGLTPSMNDRLKQSLTTHFQANRLAPIFDPGVNVERSGDGGAGAITEYDDINNVLQLYSWLEGNSAVWWRFRPTVDRNLADLLTLETGDQLTIYAEAGFKGRSLGEVVWYRVNAGYVLRRLRETGEAASDYEYLGDQFTGLGVANGRQAAYELMPSADNGGLVAPAETAERADLVAVSGGSLPSLVLQPTGTVPGELFSFITSDEVKVFSTGLVGVNLRVRSADPTITQAILRNLNFNERFQANALQEFRLSDLASQLVFNQGGARPQAFYDALADHVRYGPIGWQTGLLGGAGAERSFVPHEKAEHRPYHPTWQPKIRNAVATTANPTPDRRDQLRRAYPLCYFLAAEGDQDTDREFVITQDETDCIRQEYVFHLNWTQGGVGLFYFQGDHAYHPRDVNAGGAREGIDGGGRPVPRVGAISIPPRSRFRHRTTSEYGPILVGARPRYSSVTPAPANWRDLFDNQIVPSYQLFLEGVKRIIAGVPLPPTLNLGPVAGRFITFLQSLTPTSTGDPVRDFLGLEPNLQAALQAVNLAGNNKLQINSFWRPPEHNETVSELRDSPHQDSRGLDIQPAGGQSPLNLLALQAAGDEILGTVPSPLTQVLLEQSSSLFVHAGFDENLSSRVVTKAGNSFRLVLVAGGPAVDLDGFFLASPLGEDQPLPATGVPHPKLLSLFEKEFANFAGISAPWPNPTVERMYYFALGRASHVHFTVRA